MKKAVGHRHLPALAFLIVAFLFAGVALAQEQTGSIEGTVTDNDGAVLPGVMVRLVGPNVPGGMTTITNARGRYRFPAVPPGTYTLTAQLDGFETVKIDNVRVSLGASLTANMEMGLSTVEETIEVTSEAPIISFRASDTSTAWTPPTCRPASPRRR